MITASDVKEMALDGRVRPAPGYHAQQHGLRFEEIVGFLCFCHRVVPDRRPGHEHGFIAWGQNWGAEQCRIDFDIIKDNVGRLHIAIVTAMRVA